MFLKITDTNEYINAYTRIYLILIEFMVDTYTLVEIQFLHTLSLSSSIIQAYTIRAIDRQSI